MTEKLIQATVSLDIEEMKSHFRPAHEKEVHRLLEMANPLISAGAIYEVSDVSERFEDAILVDGIRLRSRVLKKHVSTVSRVFPYLVTIGPKLEEKMEASQDILEKYYLDTIGNVALAKARTHLENYLRSRFGIDCLSRMSPGSLADWPLEEQRPLFSLFKGAEQSLGVRLTESLLMLPRKSVSGIFFPTEVIFYSCQLCPRETCESRKAQYSEDLVKQYNL